MTQATDRVTPTFTVTYQVARGHRALLARAVREVPLVVTLARFKIMHLRLDLTIDPGRKSRFFRYKLQIAGSQMWFRWLGRPDSAFWSRYFAENIGGPRPTVPATNNTLRLAE